VLTRGEIEFMLPSSFLFHEYFKVKEDVIQEQWKYGRWIIGEALQAFFNFWYNLWIFNIMLRRICLSSCSTSTILPKQQLVAINFSAKMTRTQQQKTKDLSDELVGSETKFENRNRHSDSARAFLMKVIKINDNRDRRCREPRLIGSQPLRIKFIRY